MSAFKELGLKSTVNSLLREIAALYVEDDTPWIIGYSGGKDSTAVLQLVWMALETLPVSKRQKTVHVISTDTMVENPIVAAWVEQSHATLKVAAAKKEIPILPHRLTPALGDTFWVNLIGKGYPAPRNKFRWCTARLKIKPSNKFILDLTRKTGRAILALGVRKGESQRRARTMAEHEVDRARARLSPNASLLGCLVYSPIEDWTNDDVWLFLMQVKNPWGWNNKSLLTMYQGASADGECPLVVDTTTPSCGDSRFGCWVCTLVEQDKSMNAMIQNDAEKDWMLPLLRLRNMLDFRLMNEVDHPMKSQVPVEPSPDSDDASLTILATDRHLRDWRRMNGSVQLMEGAGKVIPGPYTQTVRERWLRELLRAQEHIRRHGPLDMKQFEIISMAELNEVRRIWVVEKNEIEDELPAIYEEETGRPFPGHALDSQPGIRSADLRLLRDQCGVEKARLYELCRDVLGVEVKNRHKRLRKPVLEELTKVFRRYEFESEAEAISALQQEKADANALNQSLA